MPHDAATTNPFFPFRRSGGWMTAFAVIGFVTGLLLACPASGAEAAGDAAPVAETAPDAKPETKPDADGAKENAAPPPPVPSAAPAAGEPTPEKKAEAEYQEKREKERKELLAQAEAFIQTADMTILSSLPYPLNLLFTTRIFSIALWRILVGVCVAFLIVFLMFLASRQINKFRSRIEHPDEGDGGRWSTGMSVALLALRSPVKIIALAILTRSVSSLVVTVYHPYFVWFSNLLLVVATAAYFFDLVGIVDKVYGARIFRSDDRLMDTVRPIALKLVRIAIAVTAALNIYQTITGQTTFSLLAGLGIGGLALALASQETLKNLLGFASIAMDKSFLVGDPVSIANFDGTVEHVGLRSTLLRTYDGNSVIIPNSAAINSNIVNRSRRPYIRREIRIALAAANPYEKVAAAMEAVREVLDGHEGKVPGLPPVVRFVDFEPARFIIQGLFWYDKDKLYFYDECSRINLEICRRLSEIGVAYAEW